MWTTAAAASPVTSPGPEQVVDGGARRGVGGPSRSLAVSCSAADSRPSSSVAEETAAAPGGCHQPKKERRSSGTTATSRSAMCCLAASVGRPATCAATALAGRHDRPGRGLDREASSPTVKRVGPGRIEGGASIGVDPLEHVPRDREPGASAVGDGSLISS